MRYRHYFLSRTGVILFFIFPLFKGRGVLYNHSKAYIKRELNSCKGETQPIPPLRKGEVRRGCTCQQIA